AYEFTHFTPAKRAVIAIIDVMTRIWVAAVSSPEESSTQVESAFIQALQAEGLWEAGTQAATDDLIAALVSGDEERIAEAIKGGDNPLLLMISDHGLQMASPPTRDFLAGGRSLNGRVVPARRRTRHGSKPCSGTSKPSGPTWSTFAMEPNSTPSSRLCATFTTRCASRQQ